MVAGPMPDGVSVEGVDDRLQKELAERRDLVAGEIDWLRKRLNEREIVHAALNQGLSTFDTAPPTPSAAAERPF